MSIQDLKKPFDPTFYTEITGAQLSQLFDGLAVFDDKGLTITTEDINGNAVSPDAATYPKFQRYLWRRVTATTVILYQWNPFIANDPSLKRWEQILQAALPANSVGTIQIMNGSVTNEKIASLAYNKLTGAPATMPPSGPAGGGLSGNYPNPTLNPTNGSIPINSLIFPVASPGRFLRIADTSLNLEFAEAGIIKRSCKTILGQKISNLVVTDGAPTSVEGTQLVSIDYTPISDSSLLRITLTGQMFTGNANAHNGIFAIFHDGTRIGMVICSDGGGYPWGQSSIDVVIPSGGTALRTIQARFGTTTDATNSAKFGLANVVGTFMIEEFFGDYAEI